MKHHIGVFFQFVTLALLPLLLFWDLSFGYSHYLIIPMVLLVACVLFAVGTKLRES